MTYDAAIALARKIKREATDKVKVTIGRTNGQSVLHIVNLGLTDRRFASNTITAPLGWHYHPWNKFFKRTQERNAGSY